MAVKRKPRQVRRPAMEIHPEDAVALERALSASVAAGDMISLRTRAFVTLLRDGAVRLKAAVALNAEEVVKDPDARRLAVLRRISQRPCEGNKYRAHTFGISQRTQSALHDYLLVVRKEGWLPEGRLAGPLFISSLHHGQGQRLTREAAMAAWDAFQRDYFDGRSQDYKLDDLVMTGRKSFLRAGGSTQALSEYAGISRRSAETYLDVLGDDAPSQQEILDRVSGK